MKTITLILLFTTSLVTQAAPYSYTDWTASNVGGGTASGTITYPNLSTVGVSFSATGDLGAPSALNNVQLSGGTNYWTPHTSTYTSPQVDNMPTNTDIIRLTGPGGGVGASIQNYVITFSQPVQDPIISMVSLGVVGTPVTYTFTAPFTIVSQGVGDFGGNNTSITNLGGNSIQGIEGNGTIQFIGTFNSLNWSTSDREIWHGFTVAVKSQNGSQISMVKSIASGSPYAAINDVINYNFVVTNTGSVSLAGPVTIADNLTTNETCPAVSTVGNNDNNFDPGEVITCTASYTVIQADLTSGSVVNTASASINGTTSPTDTATATATQNPALTMVKSITSGSPYAAINDVINYNFVVTNTGNIPLVGPITIADNLTTNESCPAVTTIGNNDNNFDPGEIITCTASYTVIQADLTSGSVVNTASAASANGTTSPTDTATATATQSPSLLVTKGSISNVSTPAVFGQTIDYTINVTNTGNVPVTNIIVTDIILGGDITSNCIFPISAASGLLPTQSATCVLSYAITSTDIAAGRVINTAVATGQDTNGGTVSDDSDSTNPGDDTGANDDPTITSIDGTPLVIPVLGLKSLLFLLILIGFIGRSFVKYKAI